MTQTSLSSPARSQATFSPEFAGKVAFVTGASSGIGRATALAFARAGASVAAVDRDEAGAVRTATEIKDAGGFALGLRCDVSEDAEVEAAVAATIAEFGRLDAAFNNAGIEQPLAPLGEVGTDDFERLVAVNLTGVYLCMRHQLPHLTAEGGTIVNTSSGAGVKGIAGQAAYCATKFGVIGLSRAAALDYAGDGVRVNVVAPGPIDTPMIDRFAGSTPEGRDAIIAQEPVGRMGSPEEIADAVLWLSSPSSAFVVGHVMVVDGGQTI